MPILKNHKHERFCQEMLVDDNATKAYIRTGYKNTAAARTAASKLLAKDNISRRVQELRYERSKQLEVDSQWVLYHLKTIAEHCMPVEVISDRQNDVNANTSMYKLDVSGALKALEMIGRHIGFFDKRDKEDTSKWNWVNVLKLIESEKKEANESKKNNI